MNIRKRVVDRIKGGYALTIVHNVFGKTLVVGSANRGGVN